MVFVEKRILLKRSGILLGTKLSLLIPGPEMQPALHQIHKLSQLACYMCPVERMWPGTLQELPCASGI